MLDAPTSDELLARVAAFLRDVVVAEAGPRTAFQARVAARVVELVRRELALGPAGEHAELARLEALLGRTGDLPTLNAALAQAIADGAFPLDAPGLADHLYATSLEKLAVDQPDYSGYRAALARAPSHKDA